MSDDLVADPGCLGFGSSLVSLRVCSSLLVKRAPNAADSLTDCEYCALFSSGVTPQYSW